jgi:hypothetical protein
MSTGYPGRRRVSLYAMGIMAHVGWGGLAGAAGTTALNAATYLDMAARGRPASSTPEDTVEVLAGKVGVTVPGGEDTRPNRLSGLGALLGTATGVGIGAVFGALRYAGLRLPGPVAAVAAGGVAMVASNGSMTALGVTDPREWHAIGWLSDALPHLAYGAVTVATLHALDRD